MEEFDFYKSVEKADDVNFLKKLIEFIDMDIKNLEKKSKKTLKTIASMYDMTPEKYLEWSLNEMNRRKQYVKQKLNGLVQDPIEDESEESEEENVSFLIGMSKEDAEKSIKDMGYTMRVIREDSQMVVINTTEFRLNRVNLEIKNGLVTNANIF